MAEKKQMQNEKRQTTLRQAFGTKPDSTKTQETSSAPAGADKHRVQNTAEPTGHPTRDDMRKHELRQEGKQVICKKCGYSRTNANRKAMGGCDFNQRIRLEGTEVWAAKWKNYLYAWEGERVKCTICKAKWGSWLSAKKAGECTGAPGKRRWQDIAEIFERQQKKPNTQDASARTWFAALGSSQQLGEVAGQIGGIDFGRLASMYREGTTEVTTNTRACKEAPANRQRKRAREADVAAIGSETEQREAGKRCMTESHACLRKRDPG